MSVELSRDEFVATITLNRPEKLNALTLEMLGQLERHLTELEKDSRLRVVILTGAGDRSFCVGADIHAWSDLDAIGMWRSWIREGHRIFDRLASINLPTLAVLNGYTFGGGLELALACDLRIAADDVELALPEVKLGIVPGWAGTHRLPALVGAARAKQMIFSGDRVPAPQAERWGLLNEVVSRNQLAERARAMADTISSNAPLAVQMAKQLVDAGQRTDSGYRPEALASGFARFTEDAAEGLAAFKEKREASFKGR